MQRSKWMESIERYSLVEINKINGDEMRGERKRYLNTQRLKKE